MGLLADPRARALAPATTTIAPSTAVRRGTRRLASALVVATTASLLAACGGADATGPPTLNWYVFHEPSGSFQAAAADCSAGAHGAYRIRIQGSRPRRTPSVSNWSGAAPPRTARWTSSVWTWCGSPFSPRRAGSRTGPGSDAGTSSRMR